MTKPKAKALGPFGLGAFVYWKDESVPNLRAVLRGTKADPTAVAAAIAGPLGAYRAQRAYLAERALPSALRDWLVLAASNVARALADGRLQRQNLPPLADSAIFHAVYRADPRRRDGSRRAVASMSLRVALLNDPTAWDAAWAGILEAGNKELIASILRSAAASIDRDAPRRRPGDEMRDELFLVVVKLLSESMDAEDAQVRARDVLEACGVDVPDADSVARSVRRRARKPGQ